MAPTCLAAILLLVLSSTGALGAELDDYADDPVALLLSSLRSDVLDFPFEPRSGHVGRGVRDVSQGQIPWYSGATLGEDDSAAREELKVTDLVKDDNFQYGAGVKKWHSLVVGSTTFLVGLGSSEVVVLTAQFVAPDIGSGHTYSLSEQKFSVAGTPLAASLFKHWNAASQSLDAILVLSIENGGLLWYRIRNGLELITSLPIPKKVAHIKVFQIEDQMKLVILTSCQSSLEMASCKASVDVFDFILKDSLDATLSRSIPLDEAAVSAEIGAVGDEVYLALALPEADVVKLYHYVRPHLSKAHQAGNHSTYGWFEFWKDIHSPQVAHAVFFHASYKMYLAVGGGKPALYRFVSPTRVEGCPNALRNIGFVSTWVILPIPTYRSEAVLLAEVVVDTKSGPTKEVIILTWSSAGVFNWQYQPKCYVGGKEAREGVSCVIAQSSELGLAGAVPFQLGDASMVTLLVPKGPEPSSRFTIFTYLQPTINPLLHEIEILRKAQEKLTNELTWQEQELQATERLLLDTLSPDGTNLIKGDWVIEEVETGYLEEEQPLPQIRIEGWLPVDHSIDFKSMEQDLINLQNSTNALLDSLSDAAIPVNGEVHLKGKVNLLGGLKVNDNVFFDSLSLNSLNGEPVTALFTDAVRLDRMGVIDGTKTFTNLITNNIDFTVVNDVPKHDLIFDVAEETVRLTGVLHVAETLEVEGDVELPPGGTVGGIDLSEDTIYPGKDFTNEVRFDEVTVEGNLTVNVINSVPMNPDSLRAYVSGVQDLDSTTTLDLLDVGGNLEVVRLNGFLWSDIVDRLVFLDSDADIGGVTSITGTLESLSSTEFSQLNGIDFPGDFVLRTKRSQYITGHKNFKNSLTARVVDVANTVDGVPVNSLVTLRTNQNLDGKLQLEEADFYGDLKVDWSVNGIRLNQVQESHPQETLIVSNMDLLNLEVLGPIQITSSVGSQSFSAVLQDIFVLPGTPNTIATIKGKKTIQGSLDVGGQGITVSSGLVNGKNITGFARKDRLQKFIGEKTIEKAVFGNLTITGTWDDVNIVELNAEAVRLSGHQDTSASLTFVNGGTLEASQLVITRQINEREVDIVPKRPSDPSCHPEYGNCTMKGSVTADYVNVVGDVVVGGKVCGWKLPEFEARRMSRSRLQHITGKYTFGSLAITDHIDVKSLNSLPVESLPRNAPPELPSYTELQTLLRSGGFSIDELNIQGNIQTNRGVNRLNLAKIAEDAVKLNSPNRFAGSLTFEDVLHVGTLDVKGRVNQLNLTDLLNDAVLKSELHSVKLLGKKTFAAGLIVEGDLHTGRLNNLDPAKIVYKTKPVTMQGTLKVLGRVHAGNVDVSGLLNNRPVSDYLNRYELLSEGRHLLKGNAHFLPSVSIDDLFVNNSVNGIPLEEFFSSVVMKNENTRITGTKYFINKVAFEEVAVKGLVNNIPLYESAKDIVLLNDESPVTVNGRVKFTESLTVTDGVHLSGNLGTSELDGCSIKEWIDNAIYLNRPMEVSGLKSFLSISSNADLKLDRLNAVDLSKVITLNTPQDIPENVNIQSLILKHNLEVGGHVNGKTLQLEYDNTLLTTGDQFVSGSKTFLNGLTVQNNVVTKGLISERNITNVVTLRGNEILNGPLKFTNMHVDGDVVVEGLVSGLNLRDWRDRAFLKSSPSVQTVTGSWDVKGKVHFMESVDGEGLLDGESVHEMAQAVYQRREYTRKIQEEIKDDWVQLCHDTDALLEKARAQPFLFRQLEVVQSIKANQPIASMHAFEALNDQFLAVSYSNKCSGAMYRWNRFKTAWELLDGAVQNMGSVQKWATLRNSDSTYLITSSVDEHNCPYQGGSIWRFERNELRNVQSIDSWHDHQIDEDSGHIHLLSRSGVDSWAAEEGMDPKIINSWRNLANPERAQFVPRSADSGLVISDGESLQLLEKLEDAMNGSISRSVNYNYPARNNGNLVAMNVGNGRRLVAVSAEASDLLVMYGDVATGQALARVKVQGAHYLSVLELAPGRVGQTLLAFIENERFLRVIQYKGVEGFVDVTKAKLPFHVKEMIPVRLYARNLVNPHHFLLLRSEYQVLLLEVEMSGDPLDEPSLDCVIP